MPGTLVAPPSSTPSVVDLIRYSGQKFSESHPSPDELKRLEPGEDVLWINVEGLADVELVADLGERFQIHRLAMEDVLYSHQSRAKDFEGHLHISFPAIEEDGETTEQVSMFVGKQFVLTFQEGRPGDPFETVRHRLRDAHGQIRERGPDYLAYALLDATIDTYFPIVDHWGDLLGNLEAEVLENPHSDLWEQICALRRKALSLRRPLRHFREAVARLLNYDGPLIQKETLPFLRDLHEHLHELLESLELFRETTSELMSTYHARLSQKTNEVMQILTIIATIFIPLSFVAGVYGMNFDRSSPYNMPELGWKYGYLFALAVMASMGIGFLFYFRRKGWLGSNKPK